MAPDKQEKQAPARDERDLSEEQLNEMAGYLEKATPGPWTVRYGVCRDHRDSSPNVETLQGEAVANCWCHATSVPNAVFIAFVRNCLPSLIAEVRRSRAARDEREVLREALRDLLSTMVLREGDMGITGPAILRARAALRAAPTPTPADPDPKGCIQEWWQSGYDAGVEDNVRGHPGSQRNVWCGPRGHSMYCPRGGLAPPAPTAEQGKALGKDEGAARAGGVLRNIEPVMCRTISALATAAALLDENDTDDECIESAREVEQMQKAMVSAHGQVLAAIETPPAAARADAVREALKAVLLARHLGHGNAIATCPDWLCKQGWTALAASPEGTPTESEDDCCSECGRPLARSGWETDRAHRCFSAISDTPAAKADCAKAKAEAGELAAIFDKMGVTIDEEKLNAAMSLSARKPRPIPVKPDDRSEQLPKGDKP